MRGSVFEMRHRPLVLTLVALLAPGVVWSAAETDPKIYYTDVTTAPGGAFVCLYGRNLGSSRGSSQVFFDGAARSNQAASYVRWGAASRGTAEHEVCVTVPSGGTVNGIVAVVNGVDSNVVPFARHSGSTYWVTKTGNDSNSCTSEANACLTLRGAANRARSGSAGYVVVVRSGLYKDEDASGDGGANLWLSGTRGDIHGTASRPNTWRAYPGDNVVLDHDGCGRNFYVSRSYIVIVGFEMIENGNRSADNTRWVNNYIHDVQRIDCSLSDRSGLNFDTNGSVAYGNTFENIGVIGRNQDHGIYVGGGSNNTIAYNDISGVAGWGVHLYAGGGTTFTGNVVHSNVIHDQHHGGVICANGCYGVDIFNNVFYGNHDQGVRVWGSGVGSRNINIYNNTFYENDELELEVLQSVTNLVVRNNIFYHAINDAGVDYIIYHSPNGGSGYTYDNNLYFAGGISQPFYRLGSSLSFSSWKQAMGGDQNSTLQDPLLENPGARNFHLDPASWAIDRASSSLAPSSDCELNGRPQGTGYDIGALEHHDGGTGLPGDAPPQVTNLRRTDTTN